MRWPALACALVLLGGCARSASEAAAEAATGAAIAAATGQEVKVEAAGERVTIGTGEEAIRLRQGAALTLPADFPRDVYLPGDYRIRSVMEMGGTRVLNLSAPGTSGQLFADARAAMAQDRWTLGTSMQHAGDASMLSFEKDGRVAVLSFVPGTDGDVQIGMQLRPQQR